MRTSVLSTALVVALVGVACSDDTTTPGTFRASLRTINEVPDTSADNNASGEAVVTIGATNLTFTLTITTQPVSPISVAHIHLGAAGSNGSVRVNLCGTGAPRPACPTAAGGSITDTASVTGVTFDSLKVAMRNFGAYVNVHTTAQGAGLFRGQLVAGAP
jgi:hypothetical protein